MSVPLALALLLAPAQPAAGVHWRVAEGCPDAASIGARIELLLQRPVDAQQLALDAEIVADPGGFRLELEVVVAGVVDRRTLIAKDCETLTDTAALVAAVLLDPVTTADTTELATRVPEPLDPLVEPPPVTTTSRRIRRADKPAEPLPVVREPPRVRTPRDRELGVWVRMSPGVQFGAVPGATGGFELALALGTRRIRGELVGSYWIGRRIPARDGIDAGARVHLGAITPRVCATVPQRRIDVIACGGLELGVMHTALADGSVRRPPWLAVVVEGGVRVPVARRLSLWVSAVAFVPARYPVLRVEDPTDPARATEVYRPSPAGVRGLIGLEVRLRGLDKR